MKRFEKSNNRHSRSWQQTRQNPAEKMVESRNKGGFAEERDLFSPLQVQNGLLGRYATRQTSGCKQRSSLQAE